MEKSNIVILFLIIFILFNKYIFGSLYCFIVYKVFNYVFWIYMVDIVNNYRFGYFKEGKVIF